MKTVATTVCIVMFLLGNFAFTQEKNIETHSIEIESFISYVVENYDRKGEGTYNLFFLIQTPPNGYSIENKVVLQQAFGLLSKRLSEDNTISILGYSGLNGVALEQNSVKKTKKMMYALENFKSSIKEFHEDGIAFAYEYADKNFDDDAINRVIMVRIPNLGTRTTQLADSTNQTKKKKNNAIVLTAIALLPEIISVLKD